MPAGLQKIPPPSKQFNHGIFADVILGVKKTAIFSGISNRRDRYLAPVLHSETDIGDMIDAGARRRFLIVEHGATGFGTFYGTVALNPWRE
jgi:hypothetical protein